MLKFPVQDGIVMLHSNTVVPTDCRMVAKAPVELPTNEPITEAGNKVAIHPEYPKQTVTIGGSLLEKGRLKLYDLLRSNLDIFAWKPADMTGVSRSIVEHRLNIRKGRPPIRQNKRGQALDRNKAIQEEVTNLIATLSHRLIGKLSPSADTLSSASWTPTKDIIKYRWKRKMRRRLPSIQVKECQNLEVCVDDLVIKSHTEQEILRDIEETFQTLKRINMKLNPKKCTFVAEEGVFLGHVVNMKGIKACPDKAEAVIRLQSLRTMKEVQSLNEKLASLNIFLSKFAEKSLPFFKTLKNCIKKNGFQWTTDAERSNQRSPVNRKRLAAYSTLFCQPSVDINYMPWTSIRCQILVDFIAKRPKEDGPPPGILVEEEIPKPWILFTDGSSCLEGSGVGLILTNPEGTECTYALRTNGCKKSAAKVDSRFVANQINGSYIAKEKSMIQYLEKVKTLISGFKKFSIKQVPRSKNKKADALSNIASTSFAHLTKQVLVEVLKEKSIEEKEILTVVE
nr:reverse transcriptase domain-containing protein [Tanacetum cinerariifolium]